MSPELQALIGDLSWTYCRQVHTCGADRACDNCRDRALDAIRLAAKATREVTVAMMRDGNNALAPWVAPAMHSAAAWDAMHAASALGEALKDD